MAISQSSRGLGLVACLEEPDLGRFPTLLKLFVQPET